MIKINFKGILRECNDQRTTTNERRKREIEKRGIMKPTSKPGSREKGNAKLRKLNERE